MHFGLTEPPLWIVSYKAECNRVLGFDSSFITGIGLGFPLSRLKHNPYHNLTCHNLVVWIWIFIFTSSLRSQPFPSTGNSWQSFPILDSVPQFVEVRPTFSTYSTFWGAVPHFWDFVTQFVEQWPAFRTSSTLELFGKLFHIFGTLFHKLWNC